MHVMMVPNGRAVTHEREDRAGDMRWVGGFGTNLNGVLRRLLANTALQPEHDLLGRLGFLVEHGLGLSAEACLLHVVTAFA